MFNQRNVFSGMQKSFNEIWDFIYYFRWIVCFSSRAFSGTQTSFEETINIRHDFTIQKYFVEIRDITYICYPRSLSKTRKSFQEIRDFKHVFRKGTFSGTQKPFEQMRDFRCAFTKGKCSWTHKPFSRKLGALSLFLPEKPFQEIRNFRCVLGTFFRNSVTQACFYQNPETFWGNYSYCVFFCLFGWLVACLLGCLVVQENPF